MTTRRCYPPSKDGCGKEKPEPEFRDGKRVDVHGKVAYRYTGWCKSCQRRRATVREAKARAKAKERAVKEHVENVRLFNLFACKLAPTEVEREPRYAPV